MLWQTIKSRKFLFLFALASAGNLVLAYLLHDPLVFWVREALIFVGLSLLLLFKPYVSEFSQESFFISSTLKTRFPILRLEFPLFLWTVGSFYAFLAWPAHVAAYSLDGPLLSGIMAYCSLKMYWVYCAINSDEVSPYYNLVRTVKIHGLRSFTTLKTIGHLCKLCFQAGLGAGVGVECYPKVVLGDFDQRGVLTNFLSYRSKGLTAETNTTMGKAGRFLEYYPNEKSLIVREDGYTIDPVKLDQQLQAKNIEIKPFFYGEIKHTHSPGSWWGPSKN